MFNSKYNFIVIFLILTSIYSCSYKSQRNIGFEEIDKLMERGIADTVFPGAALLFGIDSKIFYKKAYGNFTYDKNSPDVTTRSLFDLASVSKVVGTTSAAMLLVNKGKLDIDEKVIKYLPQFNNNGKDQVLIRHLLLHNSGLSAFKKYYDEYDKAEEIINDIVKLKLDNPPGQKYVYSDLGMIILQKVIEKISRLSLDVFLRTELFDKMDMNSTMYNPPQEKKQNCVPTEVDDYWRMRLLQGEVHDERAYMLNGIAGHAGIFSTVEDLSKFVLMLLNNGKYQDQQIIDPKIIDEWTVKQSEQSDRALGWDTKTVEGYSSAGTMFSENSFGHTGYTGTSLWIDKNNRLFVILLSNRVHPTRANRKITEFRPILHDTIYKAVFSNN